MQLINRHITNSYLNLKVYLLLQLSSIMSEPSIAELANKLQEYVTDSDENFQTINRVLFGDKYTGEKGMKEKVDDIHKLLTQVDGIGSLLKWLIVVGGAIAVLKVWFYK